METTGNTGRTIKVEILRQDTQGGNGYWQKFEVPYRHGMNVISVLMEIQKNPITADW